MVWVWNRRNRSSLYQRGDRLVAVAVVEQIFGEWHCNRCQIILITLSFSDCLRRIASMSPLHTSSFTVCSSSHHPSFQSHVHLCIALHFISVFPGYEKRGKSYFFLPFFIIYITSSRLSLYLFLCLDGFTLVMLMPHDTDGTDPTRFCLYDWYIPMSFPSLSSYVFLFAFFHTFYLYFFSPFFLSRFLLRGFFFSFLFHSIFCSLSIYLFVPEYAFFCHKSGNPFFLMKRHAPLLFFFPSFPSLFICYNSFWWFWVFGGSKKFRSY